MSESVIIETNDEALLGAGDASLGRFVVPGSDVEPLVVRIFRAPDRRERDAAAGARLSHHVDGNRYLVAGSDDVAVIDAAAGIGVAFLDDAADDAGFVGYSFIEGMALSMLTYGRGYFSIHAAGVARNGVGVALFGREGAGKSTLAVAAARRGLEVFAEDGVFVRAGPHGLEFWGLPWTQRIVLDARRFFPEFDRLEPTRQPNGELKVEIELDKHYPGRARPNAQPGAIVLLDRDAIGPDGLVPVATTDAVVETIWPWGDHWTEAHAEAERLLRALPAYRLTMNGTPDDAIDHLEVLLEGLGSPRGG